MWHFLQTRWTTFLKKRQQNKAIAPENFTTLILEIIDLTQMFEKIRPGENSAGLSIPRMQHDMRELQDLLKTKEFRHISPEKRLALKNNLIFSKLQLLEAMHSVPPPTDRIQ